MFGVPDLKNGLWIKPPQKFTMGKDIVKIITDPRTDLWQKTYYGVQKDNAHAFVFETYEKYFSFTVKSCFDYKKLFDQCGVIIYQNANNWFKASSEYVSACVQRLGSAVTNNGFSDWAWQDINPGLKEIYYRLSRRYNDFLIEWSENGKEFFQMRIFHLFQGCKKINFGIYAASPSDSSFEAEFSEMLVSECVWKEPQIIFQDRNIF